jgi:hypothetical protein
MTSVIKKLDITDYSLLENFVTSNETFSKQPNVDEVKKNWQALTITALSSENANIVACLTNGEIQAVVSQTLSSNHPFWFMNYFSSKKNTISFKNGYSESLEMCFDYVMKMAEQKGFYDFYVSIPEGYANVGPLMHKKSPSWSRYYVLTDRIISENQYPEFAVHKFVYGRVLKKHKVYIRHAVLKQEFRKEQLTPSIKY